MNPSSADGWIPTERTHPITYVQVFGSWPVIGLVLGWLWTSVLIPQDGFEYALLTVLFAVTFCALIDVFAWGVFRPSAIRASTSGVEIRRPIGSMFLIPADKLELRRQRPEGFGFVMSQPGNGFILSPNQFEAAKRFYPVVEPGAKPAAMPLP
ncbi:MAG: hypothetical protein L3J96_03810 [Thermoplasmata archaeon]|nr:hypothetical protein [Thermoplasmata archaeon]